MRVSWIYRRARDIGLNGCASSENLVVSSVQSWKEGVCSPIADVNGPCAKPVDIRKMYAQQAHAHFAKTCVFAYECMFVCQKLSWAADCGLEWPCAGEAR